MVATLLGAGSASTSVADAAASDPDQSSDAAVQASNANNTVYKTVVTGPRPVHMDIPPDEAAFSTRIRIDPSAPPLELVDMLREAPGLGVIDYGIGQRKTVTLRGSSAQQLAVYLDGVRLTSAGLGHVDLSLFDSSLLQAVEVRRSAGSARFGDAALGGAIALQTRPLSSHRESNASLGYGTFNSLQARLSHADSVGRLRFFVGGAYRQTDGDFLYINDNGDTTVRENNDSRGGELLLKLDHPLSQRWHLSLLNSFATTERGAPGPSMNPSPTARQHDLRNLTLARATHYRLAGGPGRLDLALFHRYDHYRFEEVLVDQFRFGDAPPGMDLSLSNAFALGAQARLDLPLWQRRLRLGISGEARGDLFFDEATGDRQRPTLELAADAPTRLWDGLFTVIPAARVMGASGFGATVAPKLGVVLRPLAHTPEHWATGLELVANGGRSYRYPTFQELYLRSDGIYPNPDLDPEDAWTVDAGVRWRGLPRVAFEVAYYRRWLANTILYAPTGNFRIVADNYSDVDAQGVEASVDATPGLCLAFKLAYTYTHTRFSDPPRALPGHPAHRMRGRLQWAGSRCAPQTWRHRAPRTASAARAHAASHTDRVAHDRPRGRGRHGWWSPLRHLSVWGEAVAQSEMPLDRDNSPTLTEEGRVLLSVGTSYTFRWLTLAAELNNVLDKRDAVDTLGFPLPPLTFFVSTRATF